MVLPGKCIPVSELGGTVTGCGFAGVSRAGCSTWNSMGRGRLTPLLGGVVGSMGSRRLGVGELVRWVSPWRRCVTGALRGDWKGALDVAGAVDARAVLEEISAMFCCNCRSVAAGFHAAVGCWVECVSSCTVALVGRRCLVGWGWVFQVLL